jgi:hypothetical protein
MGSLLGALLFLSVSFGGGPAERCLLDTGSELTLLRESAAARVPEAGRSWALSRQSVRGFNGTVSEGTLRRVADVRVGAARWDATLVVTLPDDQLPDYACIVGMNLLRRAAQTGPLILHLGTGELSRE